MVIGGIGYWTYYKKNMLADKLTRFVLEQTNGIYSIKSDTLVLDEVEGYLNVKNLRLKSDTLIYDTITIVKNQPAVLANVTIPNLTINGVQTPKALLNQEVVGRSVIIDSPVIELLLTGSETDTLKRMSYSETYRQILGNLKIIKVDSLIINNALLLTRDLRGNKYKHQLDSVTIGFFDIQIDSTTNQDSTRFLFAKNMNLHTKQVRILSENKLYRFVIKEVDLNTVGNKLKVKQFSINPQSNETAFMKNFKYQQDRFDIDLYDIELNNLNIPKFVLEEIYASEMVVNNSNFKIYRDMTYPRANVSKVGNYPHQMLYKLPFKIFIHTAKFYNSFIEYKERGANSGEAGKVQFKDASATIKYLTNINDSLPDSGLMSLDFESKFLGVTPLKASLGFYNASKDGQWIAKGHLSTLNAKVVNQLTEPMGLARIEDGIIKSLSFNLKGNDYRARGEVIILYNDLKVALLKQDDNNNLERKKFISWLANMKLKSNNPKKEGAEPRKGNVVYERDIKRSYFALLWKSIFEGIKESVGF